MPLPFLLPILPWLTPIVITLIGGTIICTVTVITISVLRKAIREAAEKKKKEALSAVIKKIYRHGDYAVVEAGLFGTNNKSLGEVQVRGKEIDDSIRAGMTISL